MDNWLNDMNIAQRYEDCSTIRRLLRRWEDYFDDAKVKLPRLKTWRPGILKVLSLDRLCGLSFLVLLTATHQNLYFQKLVWCLYGYLYISTFCSLSPQTLHWRSYYNGCWCQDRDKRRMHLNTELKVNRMCKDITKEAQSCWRKNPGGSWSSQVYVCQ